MSEVPSARDIARSLKANDIPFPETAPRKLSLYLAHLNRWNQHINLTRIPPEQRLHRIIIESASLLPFVSGTILDMGSGAGIPGAVLAALLPGQKIYVIDSRRKKTDFLEHIRFIADMPNMHVIRDRLERLPLHRPDLKGACGTVTARALANPALCLELGEPFLAAEGRIIIIGAGSSENKAVLSKETVTRSWKIEFRKVSMWGEAFFTLALGQRRQR